MTKRGKGTPHVNAMVLADQVYRDSDTGKFVIAGTFNQIKVQMIPVIVRLGSVYLNLSGRRA